MKKIRAWKTLSSDVILDTQHLRVSKDRVLLPNGKEQTYLKHASGQSSSVVIIAVNQKGKILIQKEYSYPPTK